jgi:predicted ATPase/DNA-binding winged helix-turn-helix (wHTH) protein
MTTTSYRFGDARLQPAQRALLVAGKDSRIGARAFDLLLALVERRERVVAKHELLDLVWPGLVVEENNLQVHISSLRKLLGPQAIATIPGRGYRFTAALDGAADAPPVAPAQTDADAPLTNLPAELPPLYGRAAELSALRTLLASHRLVSIVGAGGIGKTALALTLAHALRGDFEDGVWLVGLAPLADPLLLTGSVAGVLGIAPTPERPVETLARALAASRMLLVLDNCEHLLEGVAELADALHRAAPGLRLLVTSQEPLKLAQEQQFRLGALDLPVALGDVDAARRAGAVALFEARARAADPRFALGADNLPAVVDICRRLDGIALAIELAAARVPLLGVDGLRARLDERFRVLTGGSRLALRRHQTLRAALEWSHGLLTDDERTVFRRLGTFVGSFGLEAAQRVAADATIDEWRVLDGLSALVDKSLVLPEAGNRPRYRLLETSRAYALEQLQQAGETEALVRRHAEAVLALFEVGHAQQYGASRHAQVEHYLPDLDNARAALQWSSEGDPALHVGLAGAMVWIWHDAGLRAEGLGRTRAALAKVGAATPSAHEARLAAKWFLLAHPAAGPEEHAALARAVELYRALGDRHALCDALWRRAALLAHSQRLEEAEGALQEAEQLLDADAPASLRGQLLIARGWVRDRQGRLDEASAAQEEALRLATATDDRSLAFVALISLEQGAAVRGRLDEAVARGHELLRRLQAERTLRRGTEHLVCSNLAMALALLGRVEEGLEMARRAYPMKQAVGRLQDLMEPCAMLVLLGGRSADAARLAGRAAASFAERHMRHDPVDAQLHERLMQALRQALPPDELARSMQAGAALSDEAALRLALREQGVST